MNSKSDAIFLIPFLFLGWFIGDIFITHPERYHSEPKPQEITLNTPLFNGDTKNYLVEYNGEKYMMDITKDDIRISKVKVMPENMPASVILKVK